MTKIYIDYNDTSVNTLLNNAKTALDLINTNKTAPYDFSLKTSYDNTLKSINNSKPELNSIIKWLEKSQEDYSNFDNELNIKANRIQKISIKRRHNIVK